jgi:molecular chaperone GrpE
VTGSWNPDERFGPGDPAAGDPPVAGGADEAMAAGGDLELDVEALPTHDEVVQLRQEREAFLEQLQRERAEFANFRRRTERERAALRAAVIRDVVLQVLPVLDNLERAVAALGQQDAALAGGVDMVRVQLAQVLAAHGLTEVEAVGHPFDPNVHDAIAQVPAAAYPEGVIVEVVEKGYRTESELVRAAKVVVAAAPPATGNN